MKTSSEKEIRDLYEESAESYARMMDSEIDHPYYADTLGRLAERITGLPGLLIDSSCGSGHMLARYHECYDPSRPLLGIDLSPHMVAIAASALGSSATVRAGDMREMEWLETGSAAAVLSSFAMHHLGPADITRALNEWHRVLRAGGQLVVATWEGSGAIDYGDESDVVALRYHEEEITSWVGQAGFSVDRCVVEPVEEIPMKAIYLEATRD